MAFELSKLVETLRQAYPTSMVRLLPEPAMFLRSSTGQYVMFKSTPTGPYVKLVEPSVAKVVLKDKYVPLMND